MSVQELVPLSCWQIQDMCKEIYLKGGCDNDCYNRVSCVIAYAANKQADLHTAGLSETHVH